MIARVGFIVVDAPTLIWSTLAIGLKTKVRKNKPTNNTAIINAHDAAVRHLISMTDLNQITHQFVSAYEHNRVAQDKVKTLQKDLFAAFDEEIARRSLACQVVRFTGDPDCTKPEMRKWVTTYYPGWRWTETFDDNGIIIEEDPSLRKWSYINPETEMVVGRTVVESSPQLDDERLALEDPELWKRISDWPEPWYSLVRDTCLQWVSTRWSENALHETVGAILETHGVRRVIKDINTIDDHDLAALQEYLIPGPVSVRLIPPRKAKPEELDNV